MGPETIGELASETETESLFDSKHIGDIITDDIMDDCMVELDEKDKEEMDIQYAVTFVPTYTSYIKRSRECLSFLTNAFCNYIVSRGLVLEEYVIEKLADVPHIHAKVRSSTIYFKTLQKGYHIFFKQIYNEDGWNKYIKKELNPVVQQAYISKTIQTRNCFLDA